VRWRNLAFLIEHDWKAKPVRFDVGRKLVKLVVGEHRTQRGGLMDDRRGGPAPLRRCGQRAFEHEGAAMSANQPAADNKKITTVVVDNPDDFKGTLKRIGGSRSDHWNNVLINQAARTLWIKHSDEETQDQQCSATVAALIGIGPKDELERMTAAQLRAAHNAAMECYRSATFGEQTFEGRRENLSQANKLSRTYAVLLDALNRHRGKGQQTVRVEHVTVQASGQAIVGHVETPGEGIDRNRRNNPMQLSLHRASKCRARTRSGHPCQTSAMPNGRCQMHGGMSPGAPKGNKNAFRHGRYTADAIARRRKISGLIRAMK
jgi:hypothetical protein